MDDRELRKRGTEDARFIPADVALDYSIDAAMAQRADECELRGHTWLDPDTRTVCRHCGAGWESRRDSN